MDVFAIEMCDGTTLPAPPDTCAVAEKFTPKFPDCLVNMTMTRIPVSPLPIRDEVTSIDFSAIYVDGKPIAFKLQSGPIYELLRCDTNVGGGKCYVQMFMGVCEEQFIPIQASSIDEMVRDFLPPPLLYNGSAYPVDAKCPDGSDGCKQYCDFDDDFCYIVDSAGFVLQDSDTNYAYSDELSFDVFDVYTCDNKTHIPPPSDEYCRPSSSSDHPGGQSSTTPTPTPSSTPAPASPSTPALSSASIVKSAFTFVAIALALALF